MDSLPKRKAEAHFARAPKRAKKDSNDFGIMPKQISFGFGGFVFALISLAFCFGFVRVQDSIFEKTGWVELQHPNIPEGKHLLFPVAEVFAFTEIVEVSSFLFANAPQRSLLALYFCHFMAETESILVNDKSKSTYRRTAVYSIRVFSTGITHFLWWLVYGVVVEGVFNLPSALSAAVDMFYYFGGKFFQFAGSKFLNMLGCQSPRSDDKRIGKTAKANLVHIYTAFIMAALCVILINVILETTYTLLDFLQMLDAAESKRLSDIIRRQVYSSSLYGHQLTLFRSNEEGFKPEKSKFASISSKHSRKVQEAYASHESNYMLMHNFDESKKLEVMEKFPLDAYGQNVASHKFESIFGEKKEVLIGDQHIDVSETSTFEDREGLDLSQLIDATENTIDALGSCPVQNAWWISLSRANDAK